MNHIGIGVSCNESKISIVLAITKKAMAITRIAESEDGSIEIRGKMLEEKVGIYAVRLATDANNKDIKVVGPERINWNRVTKEFIVSLIEID